MASTSAAPAAPPSLVKSWALAIRPKTLAAGMVPVFVGTALAADAGAFAAGPALAALAVAFLVQVGTNLANDYYDFKKGADNEDRLGPARATQQGWISPNQVLAGTAVVLALAFVIGLYLTWVAGWPALAIGLVSIFFAVAYTGGPYPLAYHGLGDLFVLVFFGFVATAGTYYVQAMTVTPAVFLAAAPVGLIATAILVVNNLRDRHTDAAADKRTLAVRFGQRAARVEYTVLIAAAYLAPIVAVVTGWGGWGWLLPLVSLPLAVKNVRAIWTTDGAPLNPYLGATAKLEMVFGLLLSVGVLL